MLLKKMLFKSLLFIQCFTIQIVSKQLFTVKKIIKY